MGLLRLIFTMDQSKVTKMDLQGLKLFQIQQKLKEVDEKMNKIIVNLMAKFFHHTKGTRHYKRRIKGSICILLIQATLNNIIVEEDEAVLMKAKMMMKMIKNVIGPDTDLLSMTPQDHDEEENLRSVARDRAR